MCVYMYMRVRIYMYTYVFTAFSCCSQLQQVSGFKQYKFMAFHFRGQKSEIRCWQDCVSSDGSE